MGRIFSGIVWQLKLLIAITLKASGCGTTALGVSISLTTRLIVANENRPIELGA